MVLATGNMNVTISGDGHRRADEAISSIRFRNISNKRSR